MVETTEVKTEVIAPPVEAKPAEKPPEEPKVDWEARYKERDAEFAKLTKQAEDSRSREIALLKQSERDDLARQTAETVKLLAQAVKSQDWDAYDKQVVELDKRTVQANSTAETQALKDEALAELMQIDTELGGGLEKNPLFETVGLYWRQGTTTGNPAYFQRAVAEAHKAATKMAKEETVAQAKAHAKAIKEAVEKAAKETKEAAGVFDLGAGGAAGSSNPTATNDTIDRLWTDFDRAHPNQDNPYDKQYRALLGR